MAPKLPQNFTGSWTTGAEQNMTGPQTSVFNKTMPSPNGRLSNAIFPVSHNSFTTAVAAEWWNDSYLASKVNGCSLTCKAKVIAPALATTSCYSEEIPVDFRTPLPPSSNEAAPPLYYEAFIIVLGLNTNGAEESINLVLGYSNTHGCVGSMNLTVCNFVSAIGEYDIDISGDQAKLVSPVDPRILAIANNTKVDEQYHRSLTGHNSTLAGIVNLVYGRWYTHVIRYPTGPNKDVTGISVGSSFQHYTLPGPPSECDSFRDPTNDVIASMNKLMAYAGAHVALQNADDSDSLASIDGYPTGTQPVFSSHYGYFVAATIVEIVCIALVAPTYWGWWRIGRPCSFSPLEMAKAFEAPLLADCNSNSSGRDLARSSGAIQVKYGVIDPNREGTKLAFGRSRVADDPKDGMYFDE